jgi:transcriptional regulator with XRE-family HTH domain
LLATEIDSTEMDGDKKPEPGSPGLWKAKQPNSTDASVGQRMRLRRMLVGMSQDRLGELLDLTFQQIQKYEKGTNRIGAGRLFELAGILGVPISFFYEDADANAQAGGFAEGEEPPPVMEFLASGEGVQLNIAFMRIKDVKVRKCILHLVRQLADGGDLP